MLNTFVTQAAEPGCSDALVAYLGQADVDRVATFVASLPDQVRYRRFHRYMSPAMVHAHYDALDWESTTVLTWNEGDEILGVAEVYAYRSTGGLETEIVLTLDQDANRIGNALMAFALSRAAATGAQRSLMLLCTPDPVQFGIARRQGAQLDVAQDILVMRLELPGLPPRGVPVSLVAPRGL